MLARGCPPRVFSPRSPTSSLSFIVRSVDCSTSFSSACACSTSSSCLLLRWLLNAATFWPSRHHQPPDVEMACPVSLRYGSELTSVPGCLCDGTGTSFTACSLWYDHNPIRVCVLRERPNFVGRLPENEQCSEYRVIAVTVFCTTRRRWPLSSDVREHSV